MGSRTRRAVLAALFLALSWGCCHSPAFPTPRNELETPAAPEEPSPGAPWYIGPGERCPFMGDFCKERYIYETLEDSHAPSPSGPRSAGAPRPPAPVA
jgi:hypothetical protein